MLPSIYSCMSFCAPGDPNWIYVAVNLFSYVILFSWRPKLNVCCLQFILVCCNFVIQENQIEFHAVILYSWRPKLNGCCRQLVLLETQIELEMSHISNVPHESKLSCVVLFWVVAHYAIIMHWVFLHYSITFALFLLKIAKKARETHKKQRKSPRILYAFWRPKLTPKWLGDPKIF